jgi:hypothetical protein
MMNSFQSCYVEHAKREANDFFLKKIKNKNGPNQRCEWKYERILN